MIGNSIQCQKCGYVRSEKDENPEWQCPSCHVAYKKILDISKSALERYVPNAIRLNKRLLNLVASSFLIIYGAHGIVVNDLYLPGRRGGAHLQDESALIMYAAFICACIVMMSVVIDHYDQRDNEHKYQMVGKIFEAVGWGLFGFSLLYSLFQYILITSK